MKRGSTLFLKLVILFIAVVVVVGLIVFPQTEGRAKDLDLVRVYSDPFIIYIYLASIPFFAALYQAFKLLGCVEKNKIFSQAAVNIVKKIKYCVIAIPVLIVVAQAFIILNANDDDAAGPIALGIYIIFASLVIVTATAIFERLLQNAVDIKSENDLTV